ncbi:MAG: hypothetical protein ACI9FO_001490 [Methylophagaceae bacterium]|jgi:hypothetical protein
MSLLVLQIIIKQWDKSQRTPQHVEERAKIPDHYPITFPPAFYLFEKQCVIDPHGDDLLGNRLNYSQSENDTIQFDRYRVNISNKILQYIGQADSEAEPRTIGSLDNTWLQCKYDWRYGVDEGGFYYWLYEEITLNAIYVNDLKEDIFMKSKPVHVVML